MKMNKKLLKLSPPGIDLKAEIRLFAFVNSVSVLASLAAFIFRFMRARAGMFQINPSDGTKHIISGAVMPGFGKLAGGIPYTMLIFAAAAMLGCAFSRMMYFRHGSMSIYLMKRLPKKSELYRDILLLPLSGIVLSALIALLTRTVCLVIYIAATPAGCAAQNMWQEFWNFWRIF